jgi:hypothetical protein
MSSHDLQKFAITVFCMAKQAMQLQLRLCICLVS